MVELGDRRSYLGASDMAAVLGVSPYETPVQLYAFKVGLVPPKEQTDSMYWGTKHEAMVADEFALRSGLKIRRREREYRHRHMDYLRCHLDRIVCGEDAVLECKTADKYAQDAWGPSGSSKIPRDYFVQVQAELLTARKSVAYVAVLIGGNDFRSYEIERHDRLCYVIEKKAKWFWEDCVLERQAPPVRDLADPRILWPSQTPEKALEADLETFDAILELARLMATQGELGKQIDQGKLWLQDRMRDAEAIVDQDGIPLATWRTEKSGNRVFRVTKAAKELAR